MAQEAQKSRFGHLELVHDLLQREFGSPEELNSHSSGPRRKVSSFRSRHERSFFFLYKKACQIGSFCLRAVKFLQPHHTGRLRTQYEAQGGATSRADAILIFRGVNLSVVHCTSDGIGEQAPWTP